MEMKNTSNVQKMLQRIFFILILFSFFAHFHSPVLVVSLSIIFLCSFY